MHVPIRPKDTAQLTISANPARSQREYPSRREHRSPQRSGRGRQGRWQSSSLVCRKMLLAVVTFLAAFYAQKRSVRRHSAKNVGRPARSRLPSNLNAARRRGASRAHFQSPPSTPTPNQQQWLEIPTTRPPSEAWRAPAARDLPLPRPRSRTSPFGRSTRRPSTPAHAGESAKKMDADVQGLCCVSMRPMRKDANWGVAARELAKKHDTQRRSDRSYSFPV